MYKNFTAFTCRAYPCILPKFLKIMKLTIVLWVAALMQVSASTYAQKINLSVKNASLTEVLNSISEQSGYSFLYNSHMLKNAKLVNLNIVNESINEALDK
ncbi:MAG: SusC/RagA family TonB-linked outer membrane protein [Mucilaginibacter sp.]|nr:SusC/RagA family TonB-linked outer membrane protein [Mucilaginibacter sp.]